MPPFRLSGFLVAALMAGCAAPPPTSSPSGAAAEALPPDLVVIDRELVKTSLMFQTLKREFPSDFRRLLETLAPVVDDAEAAGAVSGRFFRDFLHTNAPLARNAPDDSLKTWAKAMEDHVTIVEAGVGPEACFRILRREPEYIDLAGNRFRTENDARSAAHVALFAAAIRRPQLRPLLTTEQVSEINTALSDAGITMKAAENSCENEIRFLRWTGELTGPAAESFRAQVAERTIRAGTADDDDN